MFWQNKKNSIFSECLSILDILRKWLLKDKDPSSVKFFDESGFQLPDAGHRNFGFSPVSDDCVEVRRYLSTANLTLIFLVGRI